MSMVVLCDFDGTITRIDTAEYILEKFAEGNWQEFEEQFENGEITLEECMRKQFSLVKVSKRQILNALENVEFRPHFGELAEYCSENLIPLTIVSAGLDFAIEHLLDLHGWKELTTIYAAKATIGANGITLDFPRLFDKTSINFKHDLARYYRNQGKTVFYIGDGSGDYAAASVADYPFAVKGSKLDELCRNNGISCRSITDFREVLSAIQRTSFKGV